MKEIKIIERGGSLTSECLLNNLNKNGIFPKKVYGESSHYRSGSDYFFSHYKLIIDNSIIKGVQFSSNCSALFINELQNIDKDLFDILLFTNGYTFAFSKENLFESSIEIMQNLFLYHLNFKYFRYYDDIYYKRYPYKEFEFQLEKDDFYKNEGDNFYCQFDDIFGYSFLFKLDIADKEIFDVPNSFFINYSRINYPHFKTVFSAVANRTGNELSIYVSKDAQ